MTIGSKLVSKWIREKMESLFSYLTGKHFPEGFDEWCRMSEPPAGWDDINYHSFRNSAQGLSDHDAIEKFISLVARSEKHWRVLTIGPPSGHFDFDLAFHAGQAPRFDQLTMDTTDVWNLETGGYFGAFRVSGLTVHNVNLHIDGCQKPIRLTNCVIGSLRLADRSGSAHKLSLELHDCWVGTLVLPQASLKNLSITGGGVANIDCPSADSPNPFNGAVTFRKVFFPTSSRQTSQFEGAQAYRSLHAHLMKHDNVLMANLIRARLLRSERETERGFTWFTNWFYGTFANYGTGPGRPILWLLGIYAVSVLIVYKSGGGALFLPVEAYQGIFSNLLEWNGGRLARSLLLPFQSIVNPFGLFFDSRRLVIADTWVLNAGLVVQGLFSDFMLVLTALSIRRRFKMG